MPTPTLKNVAQEWADLPEDQRGENVKALEYIRRLAELARVDIRRWNILATFGSGDGQNLLTEPRAINKAFFAKRAEIGASETVLSADAVKAVHWSVTQASNGEVKRTQENVKHYRRAADDTYKRYLKDLYRANSEQLRYDAMLAAQTSTEKGDAVVASLDAIIKQGFFTDLRVRKEDPSLWMRTAPVTLTKKNKRAGIDISVEMGEYAVVIMLTDGALGVSVYPYKNNLLAGGAAPHGYFHPHVGAKGAVCWGNVHEIVHDHMAKWNLKGVLDLLREILCNYSDDNQPYIALPNFQAAGKLLAEHMRREWRYPEKP